MIIAIILLLVTVEQIAIDIYLPSMPAMVHFFSASDMQIQLSLSLYMFGFSIAAFFFGPVSDKYGRRPVILKSLIAMMLFCLMCAFSSSINMLLAGRFLMGLSAGALVVTNQSMVRDSFSGEALVKVSSKMSIAWSLVPIIAPAIGGYLQSGFGWRGSFYVIAFYILMGLVAAYFLLDETLKNKQQSLAFKQLVRRYQYFFAQRSFMTYVLLTSMVYAVTTAFITASPFLLQTLLKLSPVQFGWLSLLIALAYLLGVVFNALLIKYSSTRSMIIAGLWLMFLFSALFLALGLLGYINVYVISIPIALVIFTEGFVYPNAAALAFNPIKKHIGIASALYIFIQLLSCALASCIVAKLPEINQVPLGYFLSSLTLSAILIYRWGTQSANKTPIIKSIEPSP